MIVLDEQLMDAELSAAIAAWSRSRVCNITDLRPDTVIKDEAIPTLLRQVRQPTFVTINFSDFWGRVRPDARFCMICFPLPRERRHEIPGLLRRLFRLEEFRTKAARMGKVALVSQRQVQWYQLHDSQIYTLTWPED
jgi:hypothetical protein